MKIIVIYANSGAGHRKAAESIAQAGREIYPESQFTVIDSLDYSCVLFRWIYPRSYLYLANYFPCVWGFFYRLTDRRGIYPVLAGARRMVNYFNSKPLVGYLRREKPDMVISTHFYASEVVSALKRKGMDCLLMSVITDMRLHRFWNTAPVDTFVISTEEARTDLLKSGVAAEKIEILGIPISPIFSRKEDRGTLMKRLGLEKGLPTVLVVSGGFGIGPIEKLTAHLGNLSLRAGGEGVRKRVQLLVVCGHRRRLYFRLKEMCERLSNPVRFFGFVDNMHELITAADIVVGKAGGLTTAETLAKKVPLIIVSPIPGQEGRNCEVLLNHGAAVRVKGVGEIPEVLRRLFDSPGQFNALKSGIEKLARPEAAKDIVKEGKRMVEEIEVS